MPERRGEAEVTCRELVELAGEYLEQTLEPATLDLVEEHLVLCDACREFVAQLEATIGAVAELPAEQPDAATLRALLGAFRAGVREDGA